MDAALPDAVDALSAITDVVPTDFSLRFTALPTDREGVRRTLLWALRKIQRCTGICGVVNRSIGAASRRQQEERKNLYSLHLHFFNPQHKLRFLAHKQ